MVDPRTKNSHSLKRDIRPRGVIEEIIDLNQVSSDDLNQDTSVDLLNDPMEIESHNSDDGHHEPIVDEENYSFLPKKSKSSKAYLIDYFVTFDRPIGPHMTKKKYI
ncbi:hypothetical protein RirG_133750 [Rhizophagus irregularis DAOM 197198w]|uniref:Uncharacterized protein n=1 Tax=Rhizophagus irregularis (strain DAOM 197198w) TaxID=1432141 RepID=A0A015KZB4_RHIIW|nr:hypothetical protein RirG_133750 [Rhizophagus irregularis DAOM 197198w]